MTPLHCKSPHFHFPIVYSVITFRVSSNHVGAIAQKGLRLIHTASNLGLGCGTGDFLDVDTNANSWCDPFKTWQESYSFNPTAGLTGDQVKLVLGGTFFFSVSLISVLCWLLCRPAIIMARTNYAIQFGFYFLATRCILCRIVLVRSCRKCTVWSLQVT